MPRIVTHYVERYPDAYRRPVWADGGGSGSSATSDPTAGAWEGGRRIAGYLDEVCRALVLARQFRLQGVGSTSASLLAMSSRVWITEPVAEHTEPVAEHTEPEKAEAGRKPAGDGCTMRG